MKICTRAIILDGISIPQDSGYPRLSAVLRPKGSRVSSFVSGRKVGKPLGFIKHGYTGNRCNFRNFYRPRRPFRYFTSIRGPFQLANCPSSRNQNVDAVDRPNRNENRWPTSSRLAIEKSINFESRKFQIFGSTSETFRIKTFKVF